MAAKETRTLEISAEMKDRLTSVWSRIGSSMLAVGRRIGAGLRTVGRAILNVRSLLGGLLAFLAIRRTFSWIQETAQGLDEILKSRDRINATVESLQEMAYAGDLAGASWEDVAKSIAFYQKNWELARAGTGEQYEAFRRLGISLDELPIRNGRLDATAALSEFADRLQEIQSPAERTSLMLQLLGRSGTNLGPLFAEGSAGIRRAVDELRRIGVVFDDQTLQRAADFDDALTRMSVSLRALGQSVFLSVADNKFSRVFNALALTISENRDAVAQLVVYLGTKLVQGLALIGQAVYGLIRLFAWLLDSINSIIISSRGIPIIGRLFESIEPFEGMKLGAEGAAAKVTLLRQRLVELRAAQEVENDNEVIRNQIAAIEDEITANATLGDILAVVDTQAFSLGATMDALTESFRKNFEAASAEKLAPRVPPGGAADGEDPDPERTDQRLDQTFSRFSAGIEDAWATWTDFVGAATTGAVQLGDSILDGLGGAFADIITGTKSASEAFKAFGAQILRTIAELIPRLLLVKALEGLAGIKLADGGVTPGVSGTFPVRRYADGGIARSPQIALFGEAGEEAFVPLRKGKIPVEVRSAPSSVVFAPTINAIDAASVRKMLYDERATLTALVSHGISRDMRARDSIR